MFLQVYTYYIHINSIQKFKLYSDDIGEVLQKAPHTQKCLCVVLVIRESSNSIAFITIQMRYVMVKIRTCWGVVKNIRGKKVIPFGPRRC